MRLLVRNGRIVDPASGRDAPGDLLIAEGRIVALDAAARGAAADRTIDATDLVVAPGLVDLAVRLRDLGFEHKATLESEMEAAVAGGVTTLALPPDTDPPLDEPGLVDMLRRRARALGHSRVNPVGALTVGLAGERLTEMAALADAGCVAFSQANVPLRDTEVLYRAMQYAATFGFSVWLRAEDPWLAREGVAHDGGTATRLGLPGIPVLAETVALRMLVDLARATGARLHVCRLSSAAGVEIVRRTKASGLALSCDVAVHHLHFSDEDIGDFDSLCRMDPPFRSAADRDALCAGLEDGTIDCVVSDHTPLDDDMKQLPFAEADPGATGLELLLPLVLAWGAARRLPLAKTLARVTCDPARILGVGSAKIEVGAPADVIVFDPDEEFRLTPSILRSQGRNTPLLGRDLKGRVRHTIVAGAAVFGAG